MTEPVFYLDNSEYGENISFRNLNLRTGHKHVLSFLSKPEAQLKDLSIVSNPQIPVSCDGNHRILDLEGVPANTKSVLTVSSKEYDFEFTYLLTVLPVRKKEDLIGKYVSREHKKHVIEFYPDNTGRIYLHSFLGLKEDVRILGYDFDFKSLERKLILPVQRTTEGDEVSYFYSFRYDNEKEGLLVSLSQRIQRKDSFYEEEVSLLGNKNQKEFFKRVSPLSQES